MKLYETILLHHVVSLSLSLSIYLSIYLSICLSLSLFLSFSFSLYYQLTKLPFQRLFLGPHCIHAHEIGVKRFSKHTFITRKRFQVSVISSIFEVSLHSHTHRQNRLTNGVSLIFIRYESVASCRSIFFVSHLSYPRKFKIDIEQKRPQNAKGQC